MLTPSFQLQLNEQFQPGLVCFGKFDGEQVILAAAVSGNRILLHSPHVKDKNASPTTFLRVKQKVVALAAGCLDETTGRDILFIGTAQAVQAYDVQRNADVFYIDVAEGVNCMTVGACNKSLAPLLYIGSNLSIVGVDVTGKEQMWTVTGDDVLVLAAVDADCDSRQELAAGTKACDILIFKQDALHQEFKEANFVTGLADLGQGLLAYTLANCTIGVYEGSERLWRVKSKHAVNSICSIEDEHCDANTLVSGWQNGKVEARSPASGDVVFREQLPDAVVHIACEDFRKDGCKQVIACLSNGEVRGYSSGNSLSAVLQVQKDLVSLEQNVCTIVDAYYANIPSMRVQALQSLEQKKREAAQELNLLSHNLLEHSSSASAVCVEDIIPSDTAVTCEVTANCDSQQLELAFVTNNRCVIKGVIIFAESLFAGESLFVHPEQPDTMLVVPVKPEKDCAVDMLVKVIVGSVTSDVFHVLDMKTSIVAFAMFVPQDDPNPELPEGSATFCISDAPGQVQMWLQDKFACDVHLDESGAGAMHFLCLRDSKTLVLDLEPHGSGTRFTIMADNIQVVGDIFHALASHIGLSEQSCVSEFPAQVSLARQVLRDAADGSIMATRMLADVADATAGIKSLLVKAEDSRLLNNAAEMKRHYRALRDLNRNIVGEHEKRITKHGEVARHLKLTNSVIQAAARLRLGKHKEQLVARCRKAVQEQDIEAFIHSIREGG